MQTLKRNPRYLLLPAWIRVFSWIFLVLGLFTLPLFVFSVFDDVPANFSLFGIDYEGSMRRPTPIALAACFTFLGYAGFTLLWGKKEGRVVGLAAGYLGVALVIISTLIACLNGRKTIRLELILQIPYIVALHRRRNSWNEEQNLEVSSETRR